MKSVIAPLWRILKKTPKINFTETKEYNIIPYGGTLYGIELLIEPYKNVIYCYGKVYFTEENEKLIRHYEYSILEPGNYTIEQLQSDENFGIIIGNILTHLMLKEENYA